MVTLVYHGLWSMSCLLPGFLGFFKSHTHHLTGLNRCLGGPEQTLKSKPGWSCSFPNLPPKHAKSNNLFPQFLHQWSPDRTSAGPGSTNAQRSAWDCSEWLAILGPNHLVLWWLQWLHPPFFPPKSSIIISQVFFQNPMIPTYSNWSNCWGAMTPWPGTPPPPWRWHPVHWPPGSHARAAPQEITRS
jgi:hypothetical protein